MESIIHTARLRHRLSGAAAGVALALSSAAAFAQGARPIAEPEVGLEIAKRDCASCHQVDPAQTSRIQADVPTFREIANREGANAERIAGFIVIPHPPMPTLALTRREIANLAAYIMSLRSAEPSP